jgi:sugar/nucleoside kinase (ribokinase family)
VRDSSILGDERQLQRLCQFANATGTLMTPRHGAFAALTDLQQVNQVLDETG